MDRVQGNRSAQNSYLLYCNERVRGSIFLLKGLGLTKTAENSPHAEGVLQWVILV